MNRTEEESIELLEKGETVENEVLSCEEQEVVDNSDSCNITSSTARAGQVVSREKSVELLNQSETDAENMSEKEADPKSRCCSEFLEILKNRRGHVVKTIILGLGLNAFDVFSDVGVGISHAQDKNVTRFFAANDTIPEYCVPVTMTTSDEDYEWLEDHTFWALSIFGPLAVLLAISAALAGVICAKMKSGKILLVALLPMLLPFLLFFLTEPTKLRYIWNTLFNATEPVYTHVCLEKDVVWATITFGCIQLPAVVLAL